MRSYYSPLARLAGEGGKGGEGFKRVFALTPRPSPTMWERGRTAVRSYYSPLARVRERGVRG